MKMLKVLNIFKVCKMINGYGYSFKVSKASISNTQDVLTLNNQRNGSFPVEGFSV